MRFQASVIAAALLAATPTQAAPFAEVGDSQLRADVALLGSAGVVNDLSGHWPLPWFSLLPELKGAATGQLPTQSYATARRLLTQGTAQTARGWSGGITLQAATTPALVYGFDGLGRGDGQTQLSLAYDDGATSARLSLGVFTGDFTGRSTKFMPDGSYLAHRIGDDVVVYGGWLSHWWGPGWISALALSNNARPMPQVGIQRAGGASSWPVLGWFGPWQAEFFVGLLDDPRLERNTVYTAARVAFNPLPGLEIGLARTQQMCGQGHSCVPLRDYFSVTNDPGKVNHSNDEGEIDIRWSHTFFGVPSQVYMSLMNEDSSPFVDSNTSHLFGVTIFAPVGSGSPLRLTAEYTDTVPTADMFSFGTVMHGTAYNNYSYLDGMHYRGRSLGFSLDSDSRLLSLQGAWTSRNGWFYEVSLHNAQVSNPNNLSGNVMTSAPVRINMAEARVRLPLRRMTLDIAGRVQDDQLRPHRGAEAGFEISLRAPF